jgi:hypothetical protein
MKTGFFAAGLLLAANAAAATPADYASQWTLKTDAVGAYTVVLDENIYRQVTRADLSDLAAFNADGEELAFGPLPSVYRAPPSAWSEAAWFALPPEDAASAGDLQLHVTRSADGSLSMDTAIAGTPSSTTSAAGSASKNVSDLLIDVRAKDRLIEAIAFDFAADAADFSAAIQIDASDDLKNWHEIVSDAPLAQLRQGNQVLLRRNVELSAQPATYLRVHSATPLPVRAVQLRLRAPGSEPPRATLDADPMGRDGRGFVYRLPALVTAERLTIALADDNQIAGIDVSARDPGESYWHPLGHYTAFRLRGAGVSLDAEPMELTPTRAREWRIEANGDLAKAPTLRFGYRPETWVLLTHGRAPYVLVAGSRRAHRDAFPIDALIGQLRAKEGVDWRPPPIGFGPMQASAGEAALHGWNASDRRTWVLWGLLLLGAGAVIAMVWRLLRAPG